MFELTSTSSAAAAAAAESEAEAAAKGGATSQISAKPGASAAAAASIINAAITVANAHKSTHVPGTLNVVAKVTITGGVVPFISMAVILYKDGNIAAIAAPFIGSGTGLSGNAATLCIFGPAADYYGSAGALVVFPPGYVTPVGLIGNNGPVSNINCALPPA